MTLEHLQHILQVIADWSVPLIILVIPAYAICKGVKVYEVFVEGAKEGFNVAVRVMPFLVAILMAIGMFRDVQAMEFCARIVGPITELIHMPAEILPMALIRPLSGGGAIGVMNSLFIEYGPDSYIGLMASVMQGSTETTFYVLAVYFGSVNIKRSRHALAAGLTADIFGLVCATLLCWLFFGGLAGK